MNIPEELRYTKDHEWIKIEGTSATVGITDFAQGELGDIVYLDITTKGQELSQQDVFGTVEAVKTVSDLYSPVSGEVVAINEELDKHPERVNQAPHDTWMIRVRVAGDLPADLLDASAYEALIK